MAACTTTYFDTGSAHTASIVEHNALLLAQQPMRRRGVRTPEVSFVKHFDNSRLIKAADPVRVHQMRIFTAAMTLLFSLVMFYGLQHFSAIETSYRVESEKQALDQLREDNRQLRLSEAEMTQPGRIDGLARQMGFAAPQPGQVVHATARPDNSAPILAQFTPPPPPAR